MNSISYQICKVSREELQELREFSIRTFVDTFSKQNDPADLDAYLNRSLSETQLGKELETSDSNFYFLKNGEQILGYLKLNTKAAQSDQVLDNALEIERIYIASEAQGKGLGKLLLEFAFQQARDKQLLCIWLGVWEKNEKAIAFYKHHGFEIFADHPFKLGGDIQRDLLMKRLL